MWSVLIVSYDDELIARLTRALRAVAPSLQVTARGALDMAHSVVSRGQLDALLVDMRKAHVGALSLVSDAQRAGVKVCLVAEPGQPSAMILSQTMLHVPADQPHEALVLTLAPWLGHDAPQGDATRQTLRVQPRGKEFQTLRRLSLSTRGGLVILDPAELLYAKQDYHQVTLVTRHETLQVAESLDALEAKLAHEDFRRAHEHVILHVRYLLEVEVRAGGCVARMINGDELMIDAEALGPHSPR